MTTISNRHKILFFHLARTGGNSITNAMERHMNAKEVIPKHDHVAAFREREPKKFETYFKFTQVRNPWDRVYSRYKRQVRQGVIPSTFSFEDVMKGRSGYDSWKVHSYLPNITDKKGNVLVDMVCKFETMQQDFDNVCELNNIPKIKLPHLNAAPGATDYTTVYTDELIQMVSDVYSKDIEMFGYEFGEMNEI